MTGSRSAVAAITTVALKFFLTKGAPTGIGEGNCRFYVAGLRHSKCLTVVEPHRKTLSSGKKGCGFGLTMGTTDPGNQC